MALEDLTLLPIIESYYLLLGMVVDDLALLNIVGNGGEGPYFITYYFEGWWKTFIIYYGKWCWTTLRYYPLLRMMVNDLTLLPIMENGGGRSYVITHHGEWWWTILRYYRLLGMVVEDITK